MHTVLYTVRKKSPNMEIFLVRIFPHSAWIRRDTEYFSVFIWNAGKYGPKKTPYMDTFHAVVAFSSLNSYRMNVCLYFDTFQNVVIAGLKCRSSPWRCSAKKGILKFFAKIHRKTPLLYLYKKETLAQVFCCEFYEFPRTLLLQNTSRPLLARNG